MIIGVLAAITLQTLVSGEIKARDTQRITDIDSIQGALEVYYRDNGSYPIGAAGSDRGCWLSNSSDTSCNPLYPLVANNLLPSLPYDPGKNSYVDGIASGCGYAQFYAYWSPDGVQYNLYAVIESQGHSGCVPGSPWPFLYQTVVKNH